MPTPLARLILAAVLIRAFAIAPGLAAAEKSAPPAPPPAPASPAEIPIESFFRPRAVSRPQLNPAGTHVAVLLHNLKTDANSIAIFDLATGEVKGVRGTTDLDIARFVWADDERLVFSVVKDNHYAWGLYAAHRQNPYIVTTLNSRDAVEVLGVPRARPGNLLIWIRRSARDQGRDGGVVEVNLRRSQRSLDDAMNIAESFPVPKGYAGTLRWFRDRDGEIRYVVAHRDGEFFLLRRDREDDWTRVAIDLELDDPIAVDGDPKVLFVAHRNATGARDLLRFNTVDGSCGPTIYSDEKYDFSAGSIRYSAEEKDLIGLVYARQAPEQVWLRGEEAILQRGIDTALPDRLNQIVSRSRDGKRLLVVSASDRHPGTLYLFDQETRKLKELTALAPWLPERFLAPVRLMTFTARDGLKLDGYVTVPLGYDQTKPAPMIVLPHGGPWARDVWGYDPTSQFFASRGYIVFRPNYRGSTGYNAAISRTPRMEFRKMHDDVTDGVRAFIASKIADPAHIAIVGGSFGGYLSLCGAAYEPTLYRCAITIAGVFDWKRMQQEDRDNNNEFRAAWLRRHLGDAKKDQEKFEAMSPFYAVNQIKIPIFVAHGNEDTNADTGQSRRLVKALKAAGVEHEAMFVPDESHGFAEQKHRTELFTRIEAFLKKHL